ncbi:MAG: diversity-generating retroelement protein Avd [Pseudomonadales bacterium]|uniref:Diversity-generating retroelement protein Avd n=1 Tax=Candidatus Dojkabacteria bacterium TaxID=2099670 RepID=A0A955L3Q2_9BACT|nr:diversity-generating retroelement protein Avd [Candidatus Woesebacteria bacterium]MCA9382314.1 diversity-generating retroelement protein Avd [Candidatus Dojkabacteria bacterium]MCB9801093.1 diversity-generating retroelement protein Avd [Pseudomonadales bacterium]
MCEKLLIFQKIYDLQLWIYPIINRIPKSHRLVLGRNLEEIAISLLVTTIKANKARGHIRTELQLKISDELDSLRILLRLTKDLKFMSIKQYTAGAEKVNEIGRMLQAWMKVL